MTEYITNIPLEKLKPFPNHPFQVRDDDSMRETVESIKTYGVLQPAIVRPSDDGSYEILSGIWTMTLPLFSWWIQIFSARIYCRVNELRLTR